MKALALILLVASGVAQKPAKVCRNNMTGGIIFGTRAECLAQVKHPQSYTGDPMGAEPGHGAGRDVLPACAHWACTYTYYELNPNALPICPKDTKCFIFEDATSGLSEAYDGSVNVPSSKGRIVKLSDSEYAELQKLRQAVSEKEMELATVHGVSLVDPNPCPPVCATFSGAIVWHPDHYEFRGQYLLINVPDAKK